MLFLHTSSDTEQKTSSREAFLKKQVVQKGLRYLLVGGISAAIEMALFGGIYYFFGNNAPVSNIIAVVIATCFNFLVNRTYSFKASTSLVRSIILYIILFCLNLAFTTFAIAILIHYGMLPLLAKVLAMGCVVLWNFVLYNKVIFK
jgi:putative flippase GtrA